jgi:hypothetical protein
MTPCVEAFELRNIASKSASIVTFSLRKMGAILALAVKNIFATPAILMPPCMLIVLIVIQIYLRV